LVSVHVNVNVVAALFVAAAPPLILIVPLGAVVSITIALFAHNDHAAHGATNVNVALFNAASLIVQPLNTNAHVLA